jgi:hypothetical protein
MRETTPGGWHSGKSGIVLWSLAVVILAIMASATGIVNLFAQDDMAIIWKNPAMHTLRRLDLFFQNAYWPKPFPQFLYRPLASVTLALQWVAGGGSPVWFRVGSYLIYAGAALGVFHLARRVLPLAIAGGIAALFAVHPVHVEAVAVAVNQGELWVGLLGAVAVSFWLDRRRTGELDTRSQLTLAGLYLIACLFKENALVLPGLLVMADLLFIPAPGGLRSRIDALRRPILLLGLVAACFIGLRTLVLGGNVVGTFAAEALGDLSVGERTLTMLRVVPEWFRLSFWPAHLQAEYSPGEIVSAHAWGLAQTVGALLLAGMILLAWVTRRRAPVVTFGIAWFAIAIFPVSNVLVPTGIMLAERTLFLPSVGAMLTLGGCVGWLLERAQRIRLVPVLTAASLGSLVLLGLLRSSLRQSTWKDQMTLWYTTATHDAPLSYRAHHALAELLYMVGKAGLAEGHYRRAIDLYPSSSVVYLDYADKLRLRGVCYPAVPLYRRSLELWPINDGARASLVACLLHLGRYREALVESRIGRSYGEAEDAWRTLRNLADSALAAGAPAGSVKVSMASDSLDAFANIGASK